MEQNTTQEANQTVAPVDSNRIPHTLDHSVEVREPNRPYSIPGSREAKIEYFTSGRFTS